MRKTILIATVSIMYIIMGIILNRMTTRLGVMGDLVLAQDATISILKAEKLAIIAQRDSITDDWLKAKEAMFRHYEKCAFMDKDSFFIDKYGYFRIKNPRDRE